MVGIRSTITLHEPVFEGLRFLLLLLRRAYRHNATGNGLSVRDVLCGSRVYHTAFAASLRHRPELLLLSDEFKTSRGRSRPLRVGSAARLLSKRWDFTIRRCSYLFLYQVLSPLMRSGVENSVVHSAITAQ